MSERTMQDVQIEYTKLCTLVGQAEYQITTIKNDVENLKVKMRELNIEASELKAKEDAQKSEEKVDA